MTNTIYFHNTIRDDVSTTTEEEETPPTSNRYTLQQGLSPEDDTNVDWTPIQLADQVIKGADEANSCKVEWLQLKSKSEKLAGLLRQAARAGSDLYKRPTRRIIDDNEQVLERALLLADRYRNTGVIKRYLAISPNKNSFAKMISQLDNSIGDVSWLVRVFSASATDRDRDDEYLGLPPIAANEPILCLIWEQIATLYTGTINDRSNAAASLVSLARDNDRYGKLIIEEGGVLPLLKLLQDGRTQGQENAARAIGLLGCDPESVEHMLHAGVCPVFVRVLNEACMKVQAMVAWAISELAANHPKSQDHFAQTNVIRLLVGHLAFETVQEHSKYAITRNRNMYSVVMASNQQPNTNNNNNNNNNNKITTDEEDKQNESKIPHPMGNITPNQMHNVVTNTMANNPIPKSNTKPPPAPQQQQQQTNANGKKQNNHQHNIPSAYWNTIKGREAEDPATKTMLKAMSARALWHLAARNSSICKSITESRALLCFAVLLEKGSDEVQSNSAMALMEITAVAEQDPDLRRSAFNPNSHAAKAVVDQLLQIIEKAESDLLIPCIKSIGHLAKTFKATEMRITGPLVRLLDEREAGVTREAVVALTKFACTENYLHPDHSKAVINAGGVKHLIQLVYFGEQIVQIPALVLLSYIVLNVPDNEALAEAEVLTVLEWASMQAFMVQDSSLETLLPKAKVRLELYQSRGSRGH